MKQLVTCIKIIMLAIVSSGAVAQTLTIQECYDLARQQYPLIKQHDLIEKSREYNVENASKGYLPQLNISGQASYQSDVTQIPVKIPGIPVLSKDQYRVYGEVTQPVTDVFVIKQQQELIKKNADAEQQKLEVELYKIKDRINQLFFGVLMIDEQLKQNQLSKNDVQASLDKINSAIRNGTALKSNGDVLQAEMLKSDQRAIELTSARTAYVNMLGAFTGKSLNENAILARPVEKALISTINRPELALFDTQVQTLSIEDNFLKIKNVPRLSLFFQGGYGRPALNQLKDEFDIYYITGMRLNWNFSGLYTQGHDRKINSINQQIIAAQKETFLFNTSLSLQQQNAEVSKLQQLIEKDNQIISLRTSVKNTAASQLANGTLTASDYVREVDAEEQAKENLVTHQVQLLMAQYNLANTTGN